MTITQLISLQWKESTRSMMWQKSVAINVILGFFLLYMLLNLLVLGFFMDKILMSAFPDDSPVTVFNRFLIYYFLFDLVMRFYLQELPTLKIQPFLHLPIRKSTLIHYLLVKSVLSFFNFLPLILCVSFGLKVVRPDYGSAAAWNWIVGIFLLLLVNNYLIVYIKKQLANQARWVVIFILLLGAVMLLDYLRVFSLSQASAFAFGWLLEFPHAVLVPAVLLLAVYYVNYRFIRAHTYPEEIASSQGQRNVATGNFTFLQRFGQLGELIALEMKLIWRHKRPRSVLFVSLLLIAYGLFFYTNEVYMEMPSFLIFTGIFITGIFMFNYGQFLHSWEGTYFDGLLTQRIPLFRYFQAKFWLMSVSCLIFFVLSLPYAFFGWKIIAIHLAALFFNMGVNSFVIMYFASFSPKRIELSQSTFFNYQGVGASQFILMLPTLIIPILVYLVFRLMGGETVGIAALGIIGLLGLLFYKTWLTLLVQRFQARKHQIAAGFRQE